jgi:crotonobetainyl-CoA:carnitine CoA-transferase CaiB-like acyl-CoA transferase
MERLGVTHETLTAHNPRIIYSSATGWGHLGPERHTGAMDTLAQARGGFMAVNALASGEPMASAFPQADQVGAIVSGYGIVLALLHRERTGEAQEVNTSLYGSQMCLQSFGIAGALWNGAMTPPRPREERAPTWTHFEAGDGKWFMIGALPADKWWPQFCEVMEAPQLLEPPYATAADRLPRHREVYALMAEIFARKPRDEWVRLFHERDLLVQPVADYLEIGADEQAWANEYLVNVPDEAGREWPLVGSPVHLSRTPAHVGRLGPEFGQHTEEVMLEAGYSWPEIEALRDAGAFGFPLA